VGEPAAVAARKLDGTNGSRTDVDGSEAES
jgi:hypothetical protein